MDSGASHMFLNKKKVSTPLTTPTRRPVELADGNNVLVNDQCAVFMRLTSKHRLTVVSAHCKHRSAVNMHKVVCMVMDLGDKIDVDLGQDWLDKEHTILDLWSLHMHDGQERAHL